MKKISQACLKNYSGFKTGGKAEVLLKINRRDELEKAADYLVGISFSILGKGYNTLISDRGVKGGIIVLDGEFQAIEAENCAIKAGAALSISRLLSFSWRQGLGGLEFLAGIPGTLGGALKTNCGAFGRSMSELKGSMEVYDLKRKERKIISFAEASFTYRGCRLPPEMLITGAKLSLKRADKSDILHKIKANANKKALTQPVNKKSCGCIFKNPAPGEAAGRLIEKAGMKGLNIGGAQVSSLHANFIINKNGATSEDIWKLIKKIREKVKSKWGINLEREIQLLGFTEVVGND